MDNSLLAVRDINHKYIVVEGSFIDNGNGNLDFTSDDGSIKGTIQINGWNGATFEVTETIGAVPFSVGEKFEFSFAF